MASVGGSWNCLPEAAGAFVVALAARRAWFCYHQLFAVLPRFGRRRTGLADMAALARAFSWARACGCWGTWPVAFVWAFGRVGRGAVGG
jgi:hypothetical protein